MTRIVVEASGKQQFDVMGLDPAMSGPRLLRPWTRRRWLEPCFRPLKPLLAIGACQVHSADAYDGPLVLRLMGGLVLCYPSRVLGKGRMTMEDIIGSLTHDWRFVDSEALE